MKLQRGVALITALLVVALVSVAAIGMASRQQLDIRRTGNLLHGEQARAYVLGAESWARVVLRRDLLESQVDTLEEDWATQPPASPLEGGSLIGRVLDMQGRFNLNSLVSQGQPNEDALNRYKRLLRTLDLEEALADPLIDWIDENIDVRFPDGAEDESYLLVVPPYRTANQPLSDVSELRLVKGYSPEVIERLRPFVVALPEPTAINVNTAPAEVLRALANDLTESDAEALIEARGKDGFATVDDFLKEPAMAGKPINQSDLAVTSSWFLVISEANIGQARARLASLLQRTPQQIRTVGRKRIFLEPIVAPSPKEES